MFRLSFKLALALVVMAGLMPGFAIAEIVQERLGPDGFPTNWKTSDFAIGTEIISHSVAGVSGSGVLGSVVAVSGTVMKLDRTALDGLGVLKLGSGGEAPDVWKNSPRPDTEAALARAVAQGVASPALREGWRRVLLTEAAPPPASADKGVRSSWLAVRGDTLEKLGLFEAAWGLWREVPQPAAEDDTVAAGWVRSRLLAGQGNDACVLARKKATAGGGDWAVIMAVCQLVAPAASNAQAASLSLQLVEPQLKAKNPPLLRILTAVADGKPVTTLNTPTSMVDSLGGAVLAGYPALVGPDIMPRLPDVSLRRLMGSKELPVELRGRAGLALARQTGLAQDGATAWQMVSGTAFSGALPDAVIMAKGVVGISGTDAGDYVLAALRLGLVDAAAKELPVWLQAQSLTPAAMRMRVQGELAVAALQGKVADGLWDKWLLAQVMETQAGVRQAQRTLLAVEGLGVGVPARVWQQMRDRAMPVSTLVDPAWQRLLAGMVRDEATPGVLGLISEGFAGQPPAAVVPVVIGASIEALRRVGMDDIARRVAAEAMLGIPASHLIPLVPEGKATVVTPTQVLIGVDQDGVSESAVVSASTVQMLPPPRVSAPTIHKPTVMTPVVPVRPMVRPTVR